MPWIHLSLAGVVAATGVLVAYFEWLSCFWSGPPKCCPTAECLNDPCMQAQMGVMRV